MNGPSQGVSSSLQVLGNYQTLLILQTNPLKTSAHKWHPCMSRSANAPLPRAAVKPRDLLDLCWPGLQRLERRTRPGRSCWRHRCRMCDSPAAAPGRGACQPSSSFSRASENPHSWGEWAMAFRLPDYLVSLWELQNTAPAWKMAPAQHKTFPEGKVNIWEECT